MNKKNLAMSKNIIIKKGIDIDRKKTKEWWNCKKNCKSNLK